MLSIGGDRERSLLGRFTECSGYAYMLLGLPALIAPEFLRALLMMEPFQTLRETGLLRLFGLLGLMIG